MNRNPKAGDLIQKLKQDHVRFERNCSELERFREIYNKMEMEEQEARDGE